MSPLQIRIFWAHVIQGDPEKCWPWQGSRTKSSCPSHVYGTFTIAGKTYIAHRIALWLSIGEWPGAFESCHSCDTPHCCNPSHLFKGTHQDNMNDMNRKGRNPATVPGSYRPSEPWQGEKNGTSKLTNAKVTEARQSHFQGHRTIEQISKTLSTNKRHTWDVVHGKKWSHLPFNFDISVDPADSYGRLVCCSRAKKAFTRQSSSLLL